MSMRLAVMSYHSSPLIEPGAGDSGGMTIYVRELAHAMAAVGVSTDIFTRGSTPDWRPEVISEDVRVVPIEAGPARPVDRKELPLHVDEFAAGVRSFAATQKLTYDAVHSHYWQSGMAASQIVHDWGVPFVHSHHTLGRVKNRFLAPGDEPEPQSRLDGEAAVIDSADVLIASTDDEWQQLSCLYGASHDRLKIVHPGVDHDLFRPHDRTAAREALGLGDQTVLLYVGRIQPLKGIELAIASVEQLVGAVEKEIVFLIVGGASGGRGEPEVIRLTELSRRLGVEKNVRFIGPQPHHRLPLFYNAADAVVVCSHSESFGLAALEAQACGTPVVGTAVGGLCYVVRDGTTGFLVESRDPAVFAGRLKTLLSDSDLAGAFRAAAQRSAARFSWTRAADELVELYGCLVNERAPHLCTC